MSSRTTPTEQAGRDLGAHFATAFCQLEPDVIEDIAHSLLKAAKEKREEAGGSEKKTTTIKQQSVESCVPETDQWESKKPPPPVNLESVQISDRYPAFFRPDSPLSPRNDIVEQREKVLEAIRNLGNKSQRSNEDRKIRISRVTRSGSVEMEELEKLHRLKVEFDAKPQTKTSFALVRATAQHLEYSFSSTGEIKSIHQAPNLIRLVWSSTPPQNVMLIKKPKIQKASDALLLISDFLHEKHAITSYVEPTVYDELSLESKTYVKTWQNAEESKLSTIIDFTVCLGGDGTILWATSYFDEAVPPLISFALGSLGFMTPFPISDYKENLDSAIQGKFYLTLRERLVCQVFRHQGAVEKQEASPDPMRYGADLESIHFSETGKLESTFHVLNEVCIDRGSSTMLTDLACYCDEEFVTTVRADGLLIGTPTGSTAYSLSAGGSMVHPSVPAILFTPVCPHSLSFRPLLFPNSSRILIQVRPTSRCSIRVSFDCKNHVILNHLDYIVVTASQHPVPSICRKGETSDWMQSVRDGLHWNARG